MTEQESVDRVHRLFMRKLAAEYPSHPWVIKEQSMKWLAPRRVDVWWWMQIRAYNGVSSVTNEGIVKREGTVSWNADGTGHYGVFVSFEDEGVGLHCWPDFYALSDAQSFIERLMTGTLAEAKSIHGTQWPNVVL